MEIKDIETGLKTLSEGFSGFTKNFEAFNINLNAKFDAQDARISTLEQSIKQNLIKDHGPREVNKKAWSWSRYCLAVATKDWGYAPFEREACERNRDEVIKTMTAGSFSAGGSFIPQQYINELIGLLTPNLIMTQLGVRMMTGLVGSPVSIPKITSGSTGYWVAPEGTSITASDLATGRVDLQPHTCGALVKLSNNLLMLANPSIEASVRMDITRALNEKITAAFFDGTGAAGEPLGLANQTPAIPTTAYTTTSDITKMQSIKNHVKTVDANNGLQGNLAWAMNPTAYWIIEGLNSGTGGNFFLTPNPSEPSKQALVGYPSYRSTLVNTTDKAYFGNWDDAILAIWQGLDIAASGETSTAFEKNELWVRALINVDVGVRREKSFTVTAAAITA